MPVIVFLDTGVLPRNPIALSAEFRALAELAAEDEVAVHLSSVAHREWITQRQGEFLDKVAACQSAVHALIRDRWSPTLGVRGDLNCIEEWFVANNDAVSQSTHDVAAAVLNQLRPTVIPIAGDHAVSAFDSYFVGNKPFASVKARDDIPDAFIFEALKRLAIPEGQIVHAAIHDKRLRQTAEALPQVRTYPSLKQLFEAPEIAVAQANLQRAGAWQGWMARYRDELGSLTAEVESEIRRSAVDVIAYKTINHHQIPDDNNEGTITGYDEPENIDIDWLNVEEFGVGIFSVPVQFDVGVSIDFAVFRMDAYSVPDGVSVSYGDPEHDHYYEAEAEISVHITANAVFRVPDDDVDEQIIGSIEELALVDDIDIEANENDDHSIFR